MALSRAVSMQGLQIVNFDERRITVSYPALYFHRAASEASRARDAAPLARLWASSHFWWLPLVNTPNADPCWPMLKTRPIWPTNRGSKRLIGRGWLVMAEAWGCPGPASATLCAAWRRIWPK